MGQVGLIHWNIWGYNPLTIRGMSHQVGYFMMTFNHPLNWWTIRSLAKKTRVFVPSNRLGTRKVRQLWMTPRSSKGRSTINIPSNFGLPGLVNVYTLLLEKRHWVRWFTQLNHGDFPPFLVCLPEAFSGKFHLLKGWLCSTRSIIEGWASEILKTTNLGLLKVIIKYPTTTHKSFLWVITPVIYMG